MQSKKLGDAIYLRVDKGEDVVAAIEETCRNAGVTSATFSGIGACEKVAIATYLPEKHDFKIDEAAGMFEMVSLIGNLSEGDDGKGVLHAHASFAFLDETGAHRTIAGHLHAAIVGYTAEIGIRPAAGRIGRVFQDETGIEVWDLS